MALVASTLVDLVKNLRAFAGVLVVSALTFSIVSTHLYFSVLMYVFLLLPVLGRILCVRRYWDLALSWCYISPKPKVYCSVKDSN